MVVFTIPEKLLIKSKMKSEELTIQVMCIIKLRRRIRIKTSIERKGELSQKTGTL